VKLSRASTAASIRVTHSEILLVRWWRQPDHATGYGRVEQFFILREELRSSPDTNEVHVPARRRLIRLIIQPGEDRMRLHLGAWLVGEPPPLPVVNLGHGAQGYAARGQGDLHCRLPCGVVRALHSLTVRGGTAVTVLRMSNVIGRRSIAAELLPEGGGVESFDTDAALELNEARLAHLASLGLPLDGRTVLEVGAGVGRLTGFFINRGCSVVVTEARSENVDELRRRLPTVDAREADVEETLEHFGRFDVVFCYGVLYHLESPLRALRNMADVCDELLLIETMVCDSRSAVLRLEDEPKSVNQALRGMAHRPSPSYLSMALNRVGFDYVYTATNPPDHPDYRFALLDNMDSTRDGALLRGVFIASRTPREQRGLTSLLS
jgi:SAM-dependent methyltransferase